MRGLFWFVNGPASYAYLTNAKAVAELHVVMSKATTL